MQRTQASEAKDRAPKTCWYRRDTYSIPALHTRALSKNQTLWL